STSILALAPLVAEDKVERSGIVVDAKSGVSGAGRSPKLTTHFPECNESLSAHNVGRHRHTPETDQLLPEVGRTRGHHRDEPVEVILSAHLVPRDRGMIATVYATPRQAVSEHDVRQLYRSFYAGCPFVRVVDHLPSTKDSAFTNFCDISVRVVRGKVLV